MKITKIILTGAAICGATLATVSAAERAFTSGYFALELDGTTGLLQSVEGGDVAAEVTTFTGGGDLIQKKQIGNVKYEEFGIGLGFNLPKPVYDWISDTFDGKGARKTGAIATLDHNYSGRERASFQNALITEVTFPACDATGRTPGYLNVKFAPEFLQWSAFTGGKAGPAPKKQKVWLPANFRLNVPGLDSARVTKIDAFTVKQGVVDYVDGASRSSVKVPGKIEFPNLRVTLPAAFAGTWLSWADDFLVNGNNGDDREKKGTLTFLSQDLREELVRVAFDHMGVARVHRSLSQTSDGPNTVTIELYVERMEIDFMAQFE